MPVLATQATFVRGGLVLSIWIHHSIADGTGWGRIFEVWAKNMRRIRQKDMASESMQNEFYGQGGVEPRGALDDLARRAGVHHDTTCAPSPSPSAPRCTLYGSLWHGKDTCAAHFRSQNASLSRDLSQHNKLHRSGRPPGYLH